MKRITLSTTSHWKSKALFAAVILLILSLFAASAIAGSRRKHLPPPPPLAQGEVTHERAAKAGISTTDFLHDIGPYSEETSADLPGATLERQLATSQVRRIRGNIPVSNVTTPREAADSFIKSHLSVLGVPGQQVDNVEFVREVESSGYHLTYKQRYAGLEVFHGQLSVHLSEDLSVNLVNDDLIRIVAGIPVNSPTDPERAVTLALGAVSDTNTPSAPPTTTPGIWVERTSPRAIWKVEFSTPYASWEVMVDTANNEVVFIRNTAAY